MSRIEGLTSHFRPIAKKRRLSVTLASFRYDHTGGYTIDFRLDSPLVGHEFDSEDLPLWLGGQDVHVDIRDNTFVLVIPSAIVGDNYRPVRAFAERQLELINGVGRLLNSAFRPLSLADRLFGIDSAGIVLHTILAVNPAEERDKAGSVRAIVGGKLQPDPREAAASPLLRAASLSPRARDALTIVGRPALTWSELYLLFELVQADVGSQMFDHGWISRADADLFTHTANPNPTKVQYCQR